MFLLRYMRQRRSAVFLFYIACAIFYFAIFGKAFLANLELPTVLIAPIMALGSFVAGSTFLGGGSVAFPTLTKILLVDPVTAKTFSLAIQSVGMSAAAIYIISRVRNLPVTFILLYVTGAIGGLIISLGKLESLIAPVDVRISFSLFLLCFLSIYLITRKSTNQSVDAHLEKTARDILLTIGFGVAGGVVSGLLGSGADLIAFSMLALYFRIEIVRATQISVIIMALCSIAGIGLQSIVFDQVGSEVMSFWYVAAPIVLFGAPLGAVFCRKIPAKFLLIFICVIVCVELVSTIWLIPISPERYVYYGMVCLFSCFLFWLFRKLSHLKHN